MRILGDAAVTASGWMAARAALYAMGASRSAHEWSELVDVGVEKSPREIQLESLVRSCRMGGDLNGEDRRVADFAAMLGRLVKYSSLPWPPEAEQLDECSQQPVRRFAPSLIVNQASMAARLAKDKRAGLDVEGSGDPARDRESRQSDSPVGSSRRIEPERAPVAIARRVSGGLMAV